MIRLQSALIRVIAAHHEQLVLIIYNSHMILTTGDSHGLELGSRDNLVIERI